MGDVVATGPAGLGSAPGSALMQLLAAGDLAPGDSPSYEMCKIIYLYHPLGAKIAEGPIKKAQSQDRIIVVADEPDEVVAAFQKEWMDLLIDRVILATVTQARVYAQTTLGIITDDADQSLPLIYKDLWKKVIAWNVWDPLNTSGSVIGNQIPTAIDFQKHGDIRVQGKDYHRSRTITVVNEQPIYLAWTTSAYGYTGRSVYQRILFPLKTFVQTMLTDDLVTIKAGVIVAKFKIVSSVIDNIQKWATGFKRALIKLAVLGGVISLNPEEDIASLDLTNLAEPMKMARDNSLKNIAMGSDMPALMLEDETLTEGFGEGTEDAKVIAKYVDKVRKDMDQIYAFCTQVVQYRAWSPVFYESMKAKYPAQIKEDFDTTFMRWKNKFTATWPNLLVEPDSEKSKAQKVAQEAWVSAMEVLLPKLDPTNTATTVIWFVDMINKQKELFPVPLVLDAQKLEEHAEQQEEQALQLAAAGAAGGESGEDEEPKPPKPIHDSADDESVMPNILRRSNGSASVAAIVRAVDAAASMPR